MCIRDRYTGYKEATGTFVIRYPRGKGEKKDWRNEMHVLPIGKGKKLSEGDDIAVLSIGPIGNDVIKAIEEVAGEGISVSYTHLCCCCCCIFSLLSFSFLCRISVTETPVSDALTSFSTILMQLNSCLLYTSTCCRRTASSACTAPLSSSRKRSK